MTQIKIEPYEDGLFRAFVDIPMSNISIGQARQMHRRIQNYLHKRPSADCEVSYHSNDICKFWININPHAYSDTVERLAVFMEALTLIDSNVEIDATALTSAQYAH